MTCSIINVIQRMHPKGAWSTLLSVTCLSNTCQAKSIPFYSQPYSEHTRRLAFVIAQSHQDNHEYPQTDKTLKSTDVVSGTWHKYQKRSLLLQSTNINFLLVIWFFSAADCTSINYSGNWWDRTGVWCLIWLSRAMQGCLCMWARNLEGLAQWPKTRVPLLYYVILCNWKT